MSRIKIGKVALNPKGNWVSTTTYEKLDMVISGGKTFVARDNVPVGTTTSTTTYWQQMVNSFESVTTTTVSASTGASASIIGTPDKPILSLQIPRGVSGNESIDDSAGEGDTDVVWSANKSWNEINDLQDHLVISSTTAADTTSNYYKAIETALEFIPYDFVVTAQTAGTYLFQVGIGGSADSMKETISEALTFTAGQTIRIKNYIPSNTHLKYFRLYSANISVNNTIWSLKIERVISANNISQNIEETKSITKLIKCQEISTIKGEWYNTSGSTVDITSPNSNAGWNSAVVPCTEDDVFTITGTGGSSPRLWAFVDDEGNIISHQDSLVTPSTVTDYVLYAPEDSAYFVVNFENSNPFRLVKGLLLDNRIAIEDYENRITTKHRVVVDAGGNGDYTTIQAAISSITDSAFDNQYEIALMPGTYNEQNLTLPKYTYLHGVGQTKPTITSVGLSDYVSVLDVQATCRIANIKVISATKYCIHEDVKLNDATVICENVDFEQNGTMNQTVVGNGTFICAKFLFIGCTFKGGNVFSHTNSNSVIGVTQHLEFEYCKFDDSGIVLSVSGNSDSNEMAECICKVVGCLGDETTPLITCRTPNDNVYPWKVIGGGNKNFNAVFDGSTITGVINTTD